MQQGRQNIRNISVAFTGFAIAGLAAWALNSSHKDSNEPFILDCEYTEIISALAKFESESGQFKRNDIITDIVWADQTCALAKHIEASSPYHQAQLMAPLLDRSGLVQDNGHGLWAEVFLEIVKVLPARNQSTALTMPLAVSNLSEGGHAGALIEIIEALPPLYQSEVLEMPYAVVGLADGGQADRVIGIIRVLNHSSQGLILAGPFVASALDRNGEGKALEMIKEDLKDSSSNQTITIDY